MEPESTLLPLADPDQTIDPAEPHTVKSELPESWKLLIVDDDDDVHTMTRMALREFTFEDRGVTCISARSAREARKKMREHPDIALVLLDVVMETDDAGLKLVRHIREERGNRIVQIVLRTGQPGAVPQGEAVARYDINGYSSKVELTAEKMFSIVTASFRAYYMADSLDRLNRRLAVELQERKRAEEAVRRLTRFQETVMDNMDIWLDVKDLEQNTVIWNKTAERISGYSRDRVIGNDRVLMWLYPDPPDLEDVQRQSRLDAGEAETVQFESVIRCRDGRRRTVSWNLHALKGPSGQQIGTITLGRDVTEQRLLEEQLNQARRMNVVGRMAGGLARDFAGLLTVIRGYCDLAVARVGPTERIYHHIRQVDKAAERAESLTRKILSFAIDQPLSVQPVALNLLIQKNRRMLERLVGGHIQLVLPCDQPSAEIQAHPVKIEQMLMNLVMNAVEAMPRGGTLTIGTGVVDIPGAGPDASAVGIKPGKYIQLTVADTGVGMNKEVREQIFDPFFSTKAAGKGQGLGLSTVYGIVQQSGGHIAVDSRPGEGTTVRVCFPSVGEDKPADGAPALRPEQLSGAGTILVVEDHLDVLESTAETLTLYGYHVIKRSTASDALELCRDPAVQIDLLLVDVMMPDMNGPQLVQQVQDLRPGTKVLYMSGYSRQVIPDQGGMDGDCCFIQKPFTAIRLLRMVKQVIGEDAALPGQV